MENIERTQFVVLTGHLDDQPLPDLVRTLRAQRKSGRLQVEYPDAPGSFFFEDGQLVDAQLGTLRGLEALYAALDLRGAAFNFNPLVRPPERNIDRQQQKFISDLIEAQRREALPEVEVAARRLGGPAAVPLPARNEPLQLGPVAAELIAPLEVRLVAVEAAITSASRRFSRERLLYMGVIGFLLGLVVTTAVQVFYLPRRARTPTATVAAAATTQTQNPGGADEATRGAATQQAAVAAAVVKNGQAADAGSVTRERGENASSSSSSSKRAEGASSTGRTSKSSPASARSAVKTEGGSTSGSASGSTRRGAHVVQVLMEVKNGQVTAARVLNPRPGAGDYESLALRMAKQRRYPGNFTGAERLRLRVKP